MRGIVLMMLGVLLAGCSLKDINEQLSTPGERAFAESVIAAVQRGDAASMAAGADPSIRSVVTPETVAKMKGMTPVGRPTLVAVNSNVNTTNGVTTTIKALNYELGSGNRWALFQVVLKVADGKPLLLGFHVYPADRAPTQINAFSFAGKGALHYLWILGMVAVVAISITAFVLVLRTRGVRYKWLWAIACLISLVTFTLNWTTGYVAVTPLSFQLLGAGFFQSGPLMPMMMNLAVPVFAIAFLIRRATGVYARRIEAQRDAEVAAF